MTCTLGLGLLAPTGAAPIAVEDAAHKAEAEVQVVDLPSASLSAMTDEELPSWQRFAAVPTARQASSPADASKPAAQPQAPLITPLATQPPRAQSPQNDGVKEPSLGQSINNTIKESVRPAYDQMVESGVIETLHDVKTSLGLDKNQWSGHDRADSPAKASTQWDASGGNSPYPVQPPRSAAQAQIDREQASMMREKLIDQVTPWLIGLVVLYVVVYLIRLVVRYMRWKSSRRVARARRKAMRHTRSGVRKHSHRVSTSPNAPAKSKESV